ncbi:MAG TPA: hypothetical protein PLI43_11815 [Albidovulum sp.]|uniref:hypothetical protein n=1 Tax=Albidovulum sp. TaxID=1872424 RepID=UPI002BCBCCA4|nr:hypothetical protein [Albidovulum sp.]
MRSGYFISALFISLTGCGSIDYDKAEVGRFDGSLFVMWVGEGGPLGDGAFVYVPAPGHELTFTRKTAAGKEQVIRPTMMYTDGGSIPKIGQVFKGFSPWGYAPAYMVHDWLFRARQCLSDGKATKAEAMVAGISFQESAEIIAEAIKTLQKEGRVAPDDVAPRVISSAVAGPIAQHQWRKEGACPVPRVSEADRLAAEAAIPGSSQSALRSVFRVDGKGQRRKVRAATVVGVVSF